MFRTSYRTTVTGRTVYPGKDGGEGVDTIKEETIWKDVIRKQRKCARLFHERYHYMTGPPSAILDKDELEPLVNHDRPNRAEMLATLMPHVIPLSKYLKVSPSPKPIPATTAGFIGWRCANPSYWLERYSEPSEHRRRDIRKVFNWPSGDIT
ncbi:unnamed protein product [Calicophoron daubneyi]